MVHKNKPIFSSKGQDIRHLELDLHEFLSYRSVRLLENKVPEKQILCKLECHAEPSTYFAHMAEMHFIFSKFGILNICNELFMIHNQCC